MKSWDEMTEDELTDLDREALSRGLAQAHLESAARSQQLVAKLRDGDSWMDVALLACSVMQGKSLHLAPWECRPYSINLPASLREPYGEAHRRREGAEILKKLLANGCSRFESDPAGRLKKAERAST